MSRWDKAKRAFFGPRVEQRTSLNEWVEMVNIAGQQMALWGTPSLTLGAKQEQIDPTFDGFATGLFKTNPIVFACCERRRALFSEAEVRWEDRESSNLFGTEALSVFEEPWPNGSTGSLLSRMIQDVDIAGNWFGTRRGNEILRLKPDWTVIVLGGEGYGDPNAVPVGYLYFPGGPGAGKKPLRFDVDEVAHWAPTEDPLYGFRGMSWLQPIIQEVRADKASTDHRLSYLEEGAVPATLVKPDPTLGPEEFQRFKEIFLEGHRGASQRFSTYFLGGGSDMEVVGSDLKQADFKAVQALGENRICYASGVPAIIAGAAEGLEAATYSNFGSAKRQFAEGTMRSLWRSAFTALQTLVRKSERPGGARLWYDETIPYLQEDEKDRAEVTKEKASAWKMLIEGGAEPDTATTAVDSGDFSLIKHTGLVSVQMQPADGKAAEADTNGSGDPEAIPQP